MSKISAAMLTRHQKPSSLLFIVQQCLENRLCPKLHRLNRNAFVGGVDGLREIEALRQHHWQEAIGLNTQAREKASVGNRGQQHWHRDTCRIGLFQNARQSIEESHVWFSRAGIVARHLKCYLLTKERTQFD